MNGGRLSNDETFLLGLQELRQLLQTTPPPADASERALTRIALRYPEEGEALRQLVGGAEWTRTFAVLDQLEAAHRQTVDED